MNVNQVTIKEKDRRSATVSITSKLRKEMNRGPPVACVCSRPGTYVEFNWGAKSNRQKGSGVIFGADAVNSTFSWRYSSISFAQEKSLVTYISIATDWTYRTNTRPRDMSRSTVVTGSAAGIIKIKAMTVRSRAFRKPGWVAPLELMPFVPASWWWLGGCW